MVDDQKKFGWVLYFDGSSNKSREGMGVILKGLKGFMVEYSLNFDFHMTNSQAKFEALITRLKLAKDQGVKSFLAKSDSQLVIS